MLKQIKLLYQTKQVRVLDRIAIDEFKISGFTLMQRAGRAAFSLLQKRWPKIKKIQVIVGKGNNAGDGYVIAALAKKAHLQVEVLYLCSPETLTGDALLAAQTSKKACVIIRQYDEKLIDPKAVIVDAMLGTGIVGDVRGEYRQVIEQINAINNPVFAVDVPSGLNCDSGNAFGAVIRADCTVTFVAPKQGLFTGHAANYCGEIYYDDLDLPDNVFDKVVTKTKLLQFNEIKDSLPKRERAAHKGSFGHLLVVGGNHGMAGAVRMAAEAGARVGAGLTTAVTQPEHVTVIVGQRPELMCRGVHYGSELVEFIDRSTVIVIGPGLGQDNWSMDLLRAVLHGDRPIVVDADALNLLSKNPVHRDNWILTPHPGEAARLLGCSIMEIQKDRFAAVRALQARYGGVSILKGSGSLVVGASTIVSVCSAGNPGMASGGMGDVLSGLIGGLLAQGLELERAAKIAVMLHATAADLAAVEKGERGLLALDLLPYVRKLIN